MSNPSSLIKLEGEVNTQIYSLSTQCSLINLEGGNLGDQVNTITNLQSFPTACLISYVNNFSVLIWKRIKVRMLRDKPHQTTCTGHSFPSYLSSYQPDAYKCLCRIINRKIRSVNKITCCLWDAWEKDKLYSLKMKNICPTYFKLNMT